MMKRIILFALCLVMAVSACLAEGIPEKSNMYKVSMFKEIPEKTVKKEFTQYMTPGYKIEYDTGRAWCPDLAMCGEGSFDFFGEAEDNERIRACREIAESLYRTVYPGCEPELVDAMSYRDYRLRVLMQKFSMELKDSQWYYLGQPVTHELEGAMGPAGLVRRKDRETAEQTDPSWIILHYHPGPVDGLPISMYIWPSERYCNNYGCLTTFIFDGDNHIVSAEMGGGFTVKPVKDTEITVSEEEALRIAQDYFAKEKAEHENWYSFDWSNYVGQTYEYVRKELGWSSIHAETVLEEDTGRLVMFMTSKWELVPAWEFHETLQVIADGQVIQDHFQGGMNYIYISAEDGTPGLEYGITGDYD